MNLDRGKVCASCGARNKSRWDFCVRCGEALADDEPVPFLPEAAPDDGLGAITWRPLIMGALLLAAVLAAFVMLKRPPDKPPDPALFTVGTVMPAPSGPLPKLGAPTAAAEGERLLAEGDLAAAVPLLAEAVSRDPENPKLLNLYAQALRRSGQMEAAITQWRRLVSLAPDASVRLHLARALDQSGRIDEAVAAYDDLLRVAPRDADALRLLASLYGRQGKHGEALPLLNRLAEIAPDDLVTRQSLAFVLEKTGDEPGAIEQYSRVVSAMPNASIARGRLAEAIARQGDVGRAEALLREGINLQPGVPALHRSLANLHERNGRYAEAAAAYREYARLAPNNPDAKQIAERAGQLELRATRSAS